MHYRPGKGDESAQLSTIALLPSVTTLLHNSLVGLILLLCRCGLLLRTEQRGLFVCVCLYVCMCVGRSVYHSLEPCKNGWTDGDAVWAMDSAGPKEPCTILGPATSMQRQFWGETLSAREMDGSKSKIHNSSTAEFELGETLNQVYFSCRKLCWKWQNMIYM